MYNIAGSSECNVTAEVLAYDWSYSEFLTLETHVLFQNELKLWAERQRAEEQKIADMMQRGRP